MKKASALLALCALLTTSAFAADTPAVAALAEFAETNAVAAAPKPQNTGKGAASSTYSASSWPKWTAAAVVLTAIGIGIGIAVSQSTTHHVHVH